jgi:hypothetical protein
VAKEMKKLLITAYIAASILLATTPAMAGTATYTYLCQVGHKSYPVTIRDSYPAPGTITWHRTTYRNLKAVESGCKEEFQATSDNGVTIDLCAATQGIADLRISKSDFLCQMPMSERRK